MTPGLPQWLKLKGLTPNVDVVLEPMSISFVAGRNVNGMITLETLALPLTSLNIHL